MQCEDAGGDSGGGARIGGREGWIKNAWSKFQNWFDDQFSFDPRVEWSQYVKSEWGSSAEFWAHTNSLNTNYGSTKIQSGGEKTDVSSTPVSQDSPYQVHIDPKTTKGPMAIDTSQFSSGTPTSNGGIRNRTAFWKQWANQYPDTMSDNNLQMIKNGSPVVDDIWLQTFPEHAPYAGETLVHHHLDYGPMAIPLPFSVHSLVPGFKIWHP